MIHDNAIEFYTESKTATVTLHSPRLRNRVLRLAEESDEVEVVATNEDGSILAHIPVSWIKINRPLKLTEEERKRRAEIMHRMRKASGEAASNRDENDSDDKIPD